MRVVIQRVSEASVSVNDHRVGEIQKGLLVLLGIEEADSSADAQWLARKVAQTRVFSDSAGQMNLSLKDTGGEILVVSQFTLHASTKKGNRPSFLRAAPPEHARPLYEEFLQLLSEHLSQPCQSGEFGANMQVSLINDGPVTLFMDSQNRE